MNSYRKNAIMVGVLFITATVAGIIAVAVLDPILGASDYLANVSANENQVMIGALFTFIMAFACAGIAIPMYPILKQHNETLALGAVGARIIEGVIYLVAASSLLSLLRLSQEFVQAGAPDAPYFQTLGELLLAEYYGGVQSQFAFSLGALMYYYLFYQSKLIPRWLSGWGLLGIALVLADSLFNMFGGTPFSTISILLQLPNAVNEMVLAVWLIVKGFNSSAIASES